MSGVLSFVASALMGTGDSGKPSSGGGSAGGGLCQMCRCECMRDNAVGCQLYKMGWRKPMQDLARWDGMGPWEWLWYPKNGEGLLEELPRGRDGIFTSSSSESTGLRTGLRSIWEN